MVCKKQKLFGATVFYGSIHGMQMTLRVPQFSLGHQVLRFTFWQLSRCRPLVSHHFYRFSARLRVLPDWTAFYFRCHFLASSKNALFKLEKLLIRCKSCCYSFQKNNYKRNFCRGFSDLSVKLYLSLDMIDTNSILLYLFNQGMDTNLCRFLKLVSINSNQGGLKPLSRIDFHLSKR